MNANGTWAVKACLSKQWGEVLENQTEAGTHCPPVWDGFSCWSPTPAGATASSRCPSFKGSDVTKSAFRICSIEGEWLDRDGFPSQSGWTNYTPCLTPEILEIMRRLGSNDDAQIKYNIAANTRILEFVGLSLSLAALLLSLLIFYYFRTLRNSRTRLHRHLFIAMVIQVAIRLTVYIDQTITRSMDSEENITKRDPGLSQSPRGIDNTPILCEASYISLEYARTAMFMWMFVEGLFLHNMITVTVFEEKLSPFVYPVIGWVIPIPLTMAWALVTHFHYGTATCWWGYNFTLYFWILEGPRLAVLVVNLAFLLNILRVLVMKLRQSNSSETQQALKAVKAALVLLPLLGLTNLLNMLDAPLEKSPLQFALWSYSTHILTSTQGFILAFLYCFRNGEVQIAVRKFIRIRILCNSKHIIMSKQPIPMSALDNASIIAPASSRVPSVNINQSQRTMTRITTRSDHNILSQCRNGKQKSSSSSTPPPLIVRSYSNGVLKQTTVRINPHHRAHNNHNNLRRHEGQDGTKPLLHKSNSPSVPSSPLIMPMTSSSTERSGKYIKNSCNNGINGNHSENQNNHDENNGRKIQITQMPNWRMLIIPEMFVRRNKRRRGQEIDDNHTPPEKQWERRDEIGGRDDEDENMSEEVDQVDADFVSIEINQDSSSSSSERNEPRNNGNIDRNNENSPEEDGSLEIAVEIVAD